MAGKDDHQVVFAPYWQQNPYQARLAEALGLQGVTIKDADNKGCLLFFRSPNVRRADVIHLHWLDSYFRSKSLLRSFAKAMVFILGLFWARLFGKRIVWTVHNLANHDKQHRVVERFIQFFICRLAHGIICHSEQGLVAVKKQIGGASHRFSVIPHGNYIDSYPNEICREEARRVLGCQQDDVVLLFIGLVRRYKGVLELATAFSQVPGKRLKLIIAGQCDDEGLARELSACAASDPRIKLVRGFVPDENIQLYQNAADCVAFPYKEFLTSGAVVLAMSFGKCCLVPRMGFFEECLDEQGAFFYDPDMGGSLRASIEQLSDHYDLCKAMGQYNYKQAQELGWDMIAERTKEIYN